MELMTYEWAKAEMMRLGFSEEVAESRARAEFGPPLQKSSDFRDFSSVADDAVEDEHVREGVKLCKALGFDHVSFSQKRRSKVTPGIPDHRFYHRGRKLVFWWEAKASTSVSHRKPSPAQRNFQEMCDACNDLYVLGDLNALKAFLEEMRVTEFNDDGSPEPVHLEARR